MKISPTPVVIGHRGASADAPENTVAAFRLAATQGADWVELDVHLTADGELAVVHDAVLPDGRAVANVTTATLPDDVPLLADALAASVPMGVNVEVKHGEGEPGFRPDRRIADITVEALLDAPVEVLVSSFDLGAIDRVHALAPHVATAYLVLDPSGPIDAIDACTAGGHGALHPWDPAVDAALVERAHAAGLKVNVWTVDDPVRIAQLAGFGVDGIVTNRPAACRQVLTALE